MDNIKSIIQKLKSIKGLSLYCPQCKSTVLECCKETGKPLHQCKNKGELQFKSIISVPGTKNARRTKIHKTNNLNEAIPEHYNFKKEVKSEDYKKSQDKTLSTKSEAHNQISSRPILLRQVLARYLAWLKNENVPSHIQKERSPEHLKDIEHILVFLLTTWKENGSPLDRIEITDINDHMVGLVYSAMLKKKFSPRTVNKYRGTYISIIKWYSEEYNVQMRNFFKRIPKEPENPQPKGISTKEFNALLARITPENGVKTYKNGVKQTRNLYRPWLADGFRLAYETGGRREEVINLKWSDIKIKDGIPYIETEDYKRNRIERRTDPKQKKYKYFAITSTLKQLLFDLGYEKYKDTNQFILAPEVKSTRQRVMADVLSRGFTHFYKQLNTGDELTFKCLRKTYITNLGIKFGHGNIKTITGHTNDRTIERNYTDQRMLAQSRFDTELHSQDRQVELQDVRLDKEDIAKNSDLER